MLLHVSCPSCGGDVSYEPGTEHLKCQYCQHTIEIEKSDLVEKAHEELSLDDYLNNFETLAPKQERQIINCQGCGAKTELEANQQSGFCPFCDTPIVVTQAQRESLIKPAGLLPFSIDKKQAVGNFKAWVSKLWFAPNALKKQVSQLDKFKGVYLPFWTYDCDTHSQYRGQRGDYYYVEVQERDSDGNIKTRMDRRTRWHSVSGHVQKAFDDVLVPASDSLPEDKLTSLEPWDLPALIDYKDEFISGYLCESYAIDLEQGYQKAKVIIDRAIQNKVRADIGGDEQRISEVNTSYSQATFKHILLPVWVSSYRYKDKIYQVLVNARTGKVEGERPWSWIKVTGAVILVLAVVGTGLFFANSAGQVP